MLPFLQMIFCFQSPRIFLIYWLGVEVALTMPHKDGSNSFREELAIKTILISYSKGSYEYVRDAN